jgi:sortase B
MNRIAIRGVNGIVNNIVFIIIFLLTIFAGYALWDSKQLYKGADKSGYAVYKPSAVNEGKSFKELQRLNPEVIAWLSVYGTNIDYPVTQGEDNMKYVNTNAEGQYSLSGAIFLDAGNSKDFSDFNNIIYGHHMEKKAMFGEIGSFSDKGVFDANQYGNLYFDGKDHGIEFFAFVHTDAYDSEVYTININENMRQEYLDGLLAKAMYTRDVGITTEDRIVLLSTCSSSSTNGRDLLIGKITDEIYEDTPINTKTIGEFEPPVTEGQFCFVKNIDPWLLLLILLLALRLITLIIIAYYKLKTQAKEK